MNIPVLPPDINESARDFTIVGNTIRFGLSSIKNFGEGIAETIQNEREKNGPFKNISEFLSRIESRNLNKKSLEALIKCGALDLWGERHTLLASLDDMLIYHKEMTEASPQDSLFALMPTAKPTFTLPESTTQTTLSEKLLWEKELLGIYVSGHPLDTFASTLAKATVNIEAMYTRVKVGMTIVFPALVSEIRTILTKKGDKMSFVKLEDKTGHIESVVFPKLYKEHSGLFVPGTCILIKGVVNKRNDEISIAIENVKALAK